MRESQAPSTSKRLPYLGKACIMLWDVLEKKQTDHSYARIACYVNCFVQPTAKFNTKTCLPINNHGEYRQSPFDLFSAPANRRECLKKRKSLRRIPKGAIFFFPTRRIGKLAFFFFPPTAN